MKDVIIGRRVRLTTKQIYQDQSNKSRGGQTNHNLASLGMSEYFKAVDMWITRRCMHRIAGIGKQLGLEWGWRLGSLPGATARLGCSCK